MFAVSAGLVVEHDCLSRLGKVAGSASMSK